MKNVTRKISGVWVLLVIACTLSLASCNNDDDDIKAKRKTYVLVHGAFQAAYSWNQVKATLEKQGHTVIAVELPGHGKDQTDIATISMKSYAAAVATAIQAVPGKVVLVGHSMGGMVISATAELIPEKIERLIYVGAFVPANNQSLGELAQTDADSQLGPLLAPASDPRLLTISDKSKTTAVFCHDATETIKQDLLDNYRDEPAGPFGEPVTLTAARFGSITKSYVRTTADRAIGLPLQNRMIINAGITTVQDIATGHCPHLSKATELTDILIAMSKD